MKSHQRSKLLIEYRNNQHEVVYRETTATGFKSGEPTFVIGVHENYAKAREHFEHRKGAITYTDGVIERMHKLDDALDRWSSHNHLNL